MSFSREKNPKLERSSGLQVSNRAPISGPAALARGTCSSPGRLALVVVLSGPEKNAQEAILNNCHNASYVKARRVQNSFAVRFYDPRIGTAQPVFESRTGPNDYPAFPANFALFAMNAT